VIKRWGLLLVVVLAGVIADQTTKHLAYERLHEFGIVPVIEGFFDLRYSRNRGIFFSLGADISGSMRKIAIIGGSLLAIGLIVELFRKTQEAQRCLRWALMLLLAGACGNLIDRIIDGEVIDFLHLHWREVFHWATFNVADVLITTGLGLLIIDLFQKRPSENSPLSPSQTSK
jgi:signal peptidase II